MSIETFFSAVAIAAVFIIGFTANRRLTALEQDRKIEEHRLSCPANQDRERRDNRDIIPCKNLEDD